MIVGSAGSDTLAGGDDDDVISGLAGNDIVTGAGGNDYISGDEGNDLLDGGLGNDLILDFAGINTILGGEGDDTIYGAAFAILDGGAGNDFILAGQSSTIIGGDGNDSISADIADVITSGTGIDSIYLPKSFTQTDPNTSPIIIISDFSAGSHGDRLDFGQLLAGPDTAGYTGGNPFGSIGYLQLRQDGADTVIDWDSTGGADNFLTIVRLQGVALGALTATNLGFAPDGELTQGQVISAATLGETLTGGLGNDSIFGSTGDDRLDGNAGADLMLGGSGNDTYTVDNQNDVVFELADGGTDTVISSIGTRLSSNVENLTLAPNTGAFGIGNDLANLIIGNELTNTLDGQAGNDTLQGGGASDFLFGDDGDDLLQGGSGNDMLIGEAGNDTLDGGTNPTGLGDVLLGGAGNDVYYVDSALDFIDEGKIPVYAAYGFGGFDTIRSTANFFWDVFSVGERLIIEEGAADPDGAGTTAVGSVFDNEMVGNSGTNILFGRGGSDVYRAGDGIDYISLSTLGVTDVPGYTANGVNTVIIDARTTGPLSYDIIFEFEAGRDHIDVSSYHYVSAAMVLANGVNDGLGNCYFTLGDGLDFVYLIGVEKAALSAGDFII